MKKCIGPLISLLTIILSLLAIELYLQAFAPVRDPYQVHKYANRYVSFQTFPNLQLMTEVEEGLPGMNGRHHFTTNNLGFRGDDLITPKPDNEYRVFLVGGSTTEGFYLDDRQSLEALLQQALNDNLAGDIVVKVYNSGRSGHASDDHNSLIIHRLAHLEPDMIIYFSGINDLFKGMSGYDYLHHEDSPPLQDPWPKLGLTEWQIPRRIYFLLKNINPTDQQLLETITLRSNYAERVLLQQSAPVTGQEPEMNLEAYTIHLQTAVGIAQAHRIQLIFMTQQTTWNSQVDPEAVNWHHMRYRNNVTYSEEALDRALEAYNNIMRQLAVEYDIPLLDLTETMPKSLEYFYDDVHFNVKGAQAATEALTRLILEQALIP